MKFILLGCGSSMGVPRPDGYFGKCNPKNIKNYRTRCSALLQTKSETVLIDTSPDLRHQLIKNKINKIDKVLYSHMHADQTHGINDLRVFFFKNRKPIDVYANSSTKKYLLNTFDYCFNNYSKQYPAILRLKSLSKKMFIMDGKIKRFIKPIKVKHGKVESVCYIIDEKLAYISDVSEIYKKDFKNFRNLRYLILDCLWINKHPSHFNLETSLKMINELKPKKAILTNLSPELDYDYLKNILPKNIVPAHDGLTVNL